MWTAEKSAVKSANFDYQNCLIYFLTIFTLVKSILLPNFSGDVDQTSLAKQRLPMKLADARDRYDLRASRKAAFRQPLPLLFLFLFSLPHK